MGSTTQTKLKKLADRQRHAIRVIYVAEHETKKWKK